MSKIPNEFLSLQQLADTYDSLLTEELVGYHHALENLGAIIGMLPDEPPLPETIPAIFGRSYRENFITDYLAYVLDPARNGLGEAPLRTLLYLADCDYVPEGEIESVTVQREYTLDDAGRIDLLIEIDERIIVGLENKIGAVENPGQTTSYARAIMRDFPEKTYEHCFIFLTIQGHASRSREFRAVSYGQLYEKLATITYDWLSNVRQSVLWEDFLEHTRRYLMNGRIMPELSKKTELYIAHHQMIQDLAHNYDRDAERLFKHIEEQVGLSMANGEWSINFSSKRYYQQLFRPDWGRKDLHIHYEFHFTRDLLLHKTFQLVVDVERGRTKRFIELFHKHYLALAEQYKAKEISYCPSVRSNAIAWKRMPIDSKDDLNNIADQFIDALADFQFLTPYIDQTLVELDAEISASQTQQSLEA